MTFHDLGGGSAQAPTPRNLTNEMLQTISGFEQTAPRQFALNQTYEPLYTGLGLDNSRLNLYGYDDQSGHHPGTLELNRTSTNYQRAGDINDVLQLGPASYAAFLQANPDLAYGIGQLRSRMTDTPILRALNSQAQAGLDSGGQLSPQEVRALNQQTRAGFSARGNVMGNQSLGAELLSRDAAVRQRQQQAQQLASSVQGLNQAQNDFVGRGTQIFGSTLSDPFMAVLGRSSGAAGSGAGAGAGTTPIGANTRLFDPLNPYAEDLYNTNYNAQAAANIANSNQSSAQTNALIGAGGTLLGALLLSDKRLKKNVRSTGRKTRDGIPVKRFSYRTDRTNRTYEGVLAQDVARRRPDAVVTDRVSGLKAVDYSKIEAPFAEVRRILKAA